MKVQSLDGVSSTPTFLFISMLVRPIAEPGYLILCIGSIPSRLTMIVRSTGRSYRMNTGIYGVHIHCNVDG